MKFKQNILPGDPNPNILCIGGCDIDVLQALDINPSSVRRANGGNVTVNGPAPPINRNGPVANNRPTPTPNNNRPTPNNNRPLNGGDDSTTRRNSWTMLPTPGPSGLSNTPRSTNEDIVCACNEEAVLLTVRKDGANKGRKFHKCKNQVCDFFLWASEEGGNTSTMTANVQNNNNEVSCNCGIPAARRTVLKEGPNKGRPFYCCSKSIGERCGFFQWADDGDRGGGGGGGGDDNGGGGGGGQNFRSPKWKGKQKKTKTNQSVPYNNQTRAKRKCSVCGQEGHTKNKCPRNL